MYSVLGRTVKVRAICSEPLASLSSLENGWAWLAPSSESTVFLEAASGPHSLHTVPCWSLGKSTCCL